MKKCTANTMAAVSGARPHRGMPITSALNSSAPRAGLAGTPFEALMPLIRFHWLEVPQEFIFVAQFKDDLPSQQLAHGP